MNEPPVRNKITIDWNNPLHRILLFCTTFAILIFCVLLINIASNVKSQYDIWVTVQPTLASDAPIKQQLIFPAGYEPFTCASGYQGFNNTGSSCQWICRKTSDGTYWQCTPRLIPLPTATPHR